MAESWWDVVAPSSEDYGADGGDWGTGPFDDDGAWDVMRRLALADDLQAAALDVMRSFLKSEHVYVDDAEEAIATACLVGGRLLTDVPDEDARDWLAENAIDVTDELRSLAAEVLDRVVRVGGPGENEYDEVWDEDDRATWMRKLAPYRRALSAGHPPPVSRERMATEASQMSSSVTDRRSDEDQGESNRVFAVPEASRMLAGLAEAENKEYALTLLFSRFLDLRGRLRLSVTREALAGACLVSARHSGFGVDAEPEEWLAEHELDPTEELVELAMRVIDLGARTTDNEAYQYWDGDSDLQAGWLQELSKYRNGLTGVRYRPDRVDFPEPVGGERLAESFVKDLRTGGFFTGWESETDRARILWAVARSGELLGRPVEVTFRGYTAMVFIPGFVG